MQIRDCPVCKTRNHHHVSLRYFGHLRLTRQPDEITPLYGGIASIKKPRYCEARCCSCGCLFFYGYTGLVEI